MERRFLQGSLKRLEANHRRVRRNSQWVIATIVGTLWAVTLVVSNAPLWIVTVFWLAVGFGLTIWHLLELRSAPYVEGVKSALRRSEADVYDVHATDFIRFEEIDDEGSRYAFELANGRIAFIDLHRPRARFPSLDFSVVQPLDEGGAAIDEWIEVHGVRTTPLRVISAARKRVLALPNHLETCDGPLANVEAHRQASVA